MKGKGIVNSLALGFLTLTLLTLPALAQYNVTLTLYGPTGEPLCTTTFEDIDNMTLYVPEPLYLMINATAGTTTFTAPFTVEFLLIGDGLLTLEGISIPEGWTVTFKPMTLPDFDDNGEVDVFDMVKVARSIEITVGPPENYNMFVDLNFDLVIDIFDLVEVAQHIGVIVTPPT